MFFLRNFDWILLVFFPIFLSIRTERNYFKIFEWSSLNGVAYFWQAFKRG